jgi:hypothetical protein
MRLLVLHKLLRPSVSSDSRSTARSVSRAIFTASPAARRGGSTRNMGLAESLIQSTLTASSGGGAEPCR